MARIQLLHFPTEVLHEICRFIRTPSKDDRRYSGLKLLLAFARTCRCLYTIALPVLFYDIQGHAVLLLRTLVARPDLAATVRILRFIDYERETDHDLVETTLANAGMGPPGERQGERQQDEEEDGDEDEVHSEGGMLSGRLNDAIIAHLPDLEELEYTLSFRVLGKTLLERGAFLSKLKRLQIWYNDTEGGFSLRNIAVPLKGAPKLEHLSVNMCYEVPAGLPLANLRAVNLSFSILGATDIQNLIMACPKLESFAYSSGGSVVAHYGPNREMEATPGEIQRSLLFRRSTIRHLDLNIAQWDDDYPFAEYDRRPSDFVYLESFKEFTSLETIIISNRWLPVFHQGRLEPLVGMLPKSLRVLSIADTADKSYAYIGLLELSEAVAKGQLPNLKLIEFDQSGPDAENIREGFKAAGVECQNYSSNYRFIQEE